MSAKRIFTHEQIEFVRERAESMSIKKLAEAFEVRFGEHLGWTPLKRLMSRNGIQTRHDKAKMPIPVGSEHWSDYYQCMIVKVRNVSVSGIKDQKERNRLRNSQFALKQNVVWEQANNRKLPTDCVVVFLDGDRKNYNPKNLFAAKLNEIGTIEKMNMHSENPEIYKTALIWSRLFFRMKEEQKWIPQMEM